VQPVAIFAALRWECQPVLRHLRQVTRQRLADFTVWRGHTPVHDVSLVKTGIGVQRAAAAARLLSDTQRYALFVSTGCAGALSAELVPGDLAVASAIVGVSGKERFETDGMHRDRARRAAEQAALRTTVAAVLCSPQALGSAAAKRAAAATHGAVAVEMEGAPIAARAAQIGIPFISVRAILDPLDAELGDGTRFIDPETGTVQPLAVAAYLVTHVRSLPSLAPLLRMRATAQGSLERFFGAWFADSRCESNS